MIGGMTDPHAPSRGGARVIMQVGAIGASILALALVTAAYAETGTPTETLREVFTGVNKALVGPMGRDQLARRVLNVRALLNPVLDFRNAAMRALGDEWPARTAAEQNEFVELFADLLERSCVAQVAFVADRSGGIRIDYLNEVIDGDGAMVWTSIVTRSGGVLFIRSSKPFYAQGTRRRQSRYRKRENPYRHRRRGRCPR